MLKIWLPLNGNLNNQGISNPTVTGSVASWTEGKIGKCAHFSGSQYIKISSDLTSLKNTTICMWVKGGSGNFAVGGISHDANQDVACCTLYDRKWQFTNGSNWEYIAYDGNVDGSKWHHYACSIDNSKIYLYIDGVLNVTHDIGNKLTNLSSKNFFEIGCDHPGGDEYLVGDINDFRIYDYCLSPREIKEISKALICHYPLSDIASTSSVNKYKGTFFDGKGSSLSYTITKLSDERGYNVKGTYANTDGANKWYNMQFPNYSFTAGKVYDYSCKIRVNSANHYIYLRAARCYNDWTTTIVVPVSPSLADGKWHEYHVRQTVNSTFDRSGTTITCNPLLEFYSQSLDVSGTTYTVDFDIKDVQVSECTVNAPANDGNWFNGLVYDTSGFGNHGTVASSTAPTWNNDSPRYDGCYVFNGTSQFLTAPQSVKVTDEITVSIWAYMTTWSGNINPISCTQNGGWNIENSGGYINFPLYANGAYRSCTSKKLWSSLSSGWHHFAISYNGLKMCLYIDGTLDTTITPFTTKTPITYNTSNTVFIGAEAGGNATKPDGSSYFNGKLSDFRLYATALSDSDIKELYNSPICITDTGTLMTQGEFKET